ncbi:copine-8 [Elysia marginata]|uniref:Copine-8 n=1 Tax=Elysia marginata TaxID=1093978 RepID=A0AAV4JSQ3_9GAST|nr:copine-8 [Elysia marginata]
MASARSLATCVVIEEEQATLQFCAHKLDKKDLFGKSDPFLTFSRSNEDGSYTVVHRTEVIKKTLNPTWRPFSISIRTLCNGDYDRSIKVECHDWDADGGHDYIGSFMTTVRELSRGQCAGNIYECISEKKRAKKGKKYQNSGTVELMSCRIEKVFTFLDYIRGGTRIHCTFSVDFTASNGDPKMPASLHYMNPYRPNPYAMAIKSVGNIIQDYDSAKMFPALGFGARLPPDGIVSHEFALVLNASYFIIILIINMSGKIVRIITTTIIIIITNGNLSINISSHTNKQEKDKNCYWQYKIVEIVESGVAKVDHI